MSKKNVCIRKYKTLDFSKLVQKLTNATFTNYLH